MYSKCGIRACAFSCTIGSEVFNSESFGFLLRTLIKNKKYGGLLKYGIHSYHYSFSYHHPFDS